MYFIIDTATIGQSQFFGVGILLTLATGTLLAIRRGVAPYQIWVLITGLMAVAAVGGRLTAWLISPQDVPQPLNPFSTGYASMGAILGGGVFSLPFVRMKTFWKLADVLVPSLLVGLAATRVGCLFQGCDFGVPMATGVAYLAPSPAFELHRSLGLVSASALHSLPTFPLPVVLAAGGVLGVVVGVRYQSTDGTGALLAALTYFLMRSAAEPFRAVDGVNVNLPASTLGVTVILVVWWLRRRQGDR